MAGEGPRGAGPGAGEGLGARGQGREPDAPGVSAGAGGGGCPAGGNDLQWCFSQVKGAVDEDVAEGKAVHLGAPGPGWAAPGRGAGRARDRRSGPPGRRRRPGP